ncbi:hypothetical protein ACFS07_33385 [Undibacterium arcticum]
MRVEVMEHYGLTQAFSQAGYYETEHHQQLIKDIKGAIMQGRLIAVCGVVGSGKTVTLRRLQQILKEEKSRDRRKNRFRWRSTASSSPP